MRTKTSFIILAISVIILFVMIFLSISLIGLNPKNVKQKVNNGSQKIEITSSEKQEIDGWIYKNKLNPYGDPYDTVYTGGTPLFDEISGEKKDRYLYVLEQHPDRPWK